MKTSIEEAKKLNQQSIKNLMAHILEMSDSQVLYGTFEGKAPSLLLHGESARDWAINLCINKNPHDGGTVLRAVGWGQHKIFCSAFIDDTYPICRVRLGEQFLSPSPLSIETQSIYPLAEEARKILRAILIPPNSSTGAAARIACAYLDKKEDSFL
jgi:hypothetical protein